MSRTYRKRTYPRLVRDIVREMTSHPVARARLVRYLSRSVWWQITKRTTRSPQDRRLAWNHTLRCYPDSTSASNVVYFSEFFDHAEMCFISRYLRPADAVVDGGANIGVYTLLFAYLVGDSGRVDSYEPEPVAFARLRENVAINALERIVTCHRAALGDERGTVAFTVDADVSNRVAAPDDTSRPVETVAVVPLGPRLEERRYAFAKLDLEGYEFRALQGMLKELEKGNPPVLLLEFIPHLVEKAGSRIEDAKDFLDGLGYTFFEYREEQRLLVPTEDLRGNVLAIRTEELPDVQRRLTGPTPPGVRRFLSEP